MDQRSTSIGQSRHSGGGVRAVLPLLILALLGTVKVGRFVYLNMKLQNVASNVADIVSRPDQVAASDLSNLSTAAPFMMRPFQASEHLRIIVTGAVVPNETDPAEVVWQAAGGGTLSPSSQVGEIGYTAAVPEGLVYFGGEALIVSEVFYAYDH